VRALAQVVAEATGRGGTRLTTLHGDPPIALRESGDGLYLVGSAQGLLADDHLTLDVVVGPGASLCVRSVAATVAYASRGAILEIRARVGPAGSLIWCPQPLVATARCRLAMRARIVLDAGARLDWTDECQIGRAGEALGVLDLSLSMAVDGPSGPLFAHELVIGERSPGWDGPAVLGASRAVAQRVVATGSIGNPVATAHPASGTGWARLPLEAGGHVVSAVGVDLIEVRRRLAEAARASGVGAEPT
jgi:urease accessory protein